MKQKGNTIIIVVILVIALAAIGYLVYQNMQLKKQAVTPSPVPTTINSVVPTSIPTATASPSQSLKPGWKLYQNQQYGFEFSYPSEYKVSTSKDDLYGWPDAILLLYKGGQSYDLAVEIWETEAQYKAKYNDSSILTVFKAKDGKFVTLLNQNKDPEVSEIIDTFKLTN
jgi:hypothetical protein